MLEITEVVAMYWGRLTIRLRNSELLGLSVELDLQLSMLFPQGVQLFNGLVQALAQCDCSFGTDIKVSLRGAKPNEQYTHPSPMLFPLRISSRSFCRTSFSRCAAR